MTTEANQQNGGAEAEVLTAGGTQTEQASVEVAQEPAKTEIVEPGATAATSQAPTTVSQPADPAKGANVFQNPGQAPAGVPATAIAPAPAVATAPAGGGTTQEVMDIDFDTEVKLNTLDKVPKYKNGEARRQAFVLFNPQTGAPMIKMSQYFYDNALQKSWLAPKNENMLKQCIAKYGDPKIKFGTIIVQYDTDQYGNVLMQAPSELNPYGWTFQLKAFVFSTDKFPILKTLHQQWNLASRDIMVQCQEETFQKLTFMPCQESYILSDKALVERIQKEAMELYEKRLVKMMGRPATDQEILSYLGMGPAPAMGGVGGNPGMASPFANPGMVSAGHAPVGVNPAAAMSGTVGMGGPATGEFADVAKPAPAATPGTAAPPPGAGNQSGQ